MQSTFARQVSLPSWDFPAHMVGRFRPIAIPRLTFMLDPLDRSGRTVSLINVTITSNSASSGGGGLYVASIQSVNSRNSLIANNQSASGHADVDNFFQTHTVTSNGNNLVRDPRPGIGFTNGVNNDIVGIDPLVGPLANNGGPTDTHAILPGSPSRDAGNDCVFNGTCGVTLPLDQRGPGFTRLFGTHVDIGAFEYEITHFTVTKTADTNDGSCDPGDCSLREAIEAANANPDENVIDFSPAVFNTPRSIVLGAQLTIANPVSILGPSGGLLVRAGPLGNRVFQVEPGATASIFDVAIGNAVPAESGGCILNNGTLTLERVLVNSCTSIVSSGGGVYNTGTLTILNSTFSGNSAITNAGAIGNTGTLTLINSTITQNNANAGGGVFSFFGSTTVVVNTIIAGNTNLDGQSPDVVGDFISQGHNFIGRSDGSAGFTDGVNGDQVGTNAAPKDPMLGLLADNGGPTFTHALLIGSTAINGGDSLAAANAGLTTDQRGFNRQSGPAVDIGAYERLVPTAAGVSISGRVIDGFRPLSGAIVQLVALDGSVQITRTNAFGNFAFGDLRVGQTVFLSVFAKGYTFEPQAISPIDDISGLLFVGHGENLSSKER